MEFEVASAGPVGGIPVVLCHGFPDLGRSWAPQLDALAAAGYRALAPDQRGYGGSAKPTAIEAYSLAELCGDLVGLLDALDIDRAVFVGHDWGGFVAWAMPVLHPDRCLGVAGVCTPYMPFPTTGLLRQLFPDPDKMYMLWFQEPGVAEAVLDAHVEEVFSKLFVAGSDPVELMAAAFERSGGEPDLNPFRSIAELEPIGESLLQGSDLEAYVDAFTSGGFAGPVNWYRNIDRNAAEYPGLGVQPLDLPCLMICAEWDPVLSPAMAADMPERISDLEMHTVERAGHFVHIERPTEVAELLLGWLQRRFPTPDQT
jgi:pimeloyl-ACP methyl ester carboxylesterase